MGSRESKASGAQKSTASTTSKGKGQVDSVNVEIRGQRLAIRTDRDPAYVEGLASYIDDKVKALQAAAPMAPFEKLLMLASMTVAEELFEAREEASALRNEISERAETMRELLEKVEP